jgi:hypothetical protein
MIFSGGTIRGLDLAPGEVMLIRDIDDLVSPPGGSSSSRPPIPVTIRDHLTMGEASVLQLPFEADTWDSVISFEPGIPVELGGTLELSFANDVDATTQVGRTLQVFDWTGVEPAGAFHVSGQYLWDLSNLYSTGDVRLTGTGAAADNDGSGKVDQGDLDLVLLNWGTEFLDAPALGWANDLPVGPVDQGELDKVLLNWGSTPGSLSSASVPEPTALAIMLILLLAIATARRPR